MALTKKKSEQIQKAVAGLLKNSGVTKPPVPVERIAKLRGAEVRYVAFDGDVSGLLAKEEGHVIIGVNVLHPNTRQRFTIAHEIGHWELNHLDLYGDNEIHVDRNFKMMLRDGKSSQATDIAEIEANSYAAELLMPTCMLMDERELRNGVDYDDDELIQNLATRYKVSKQAMTFRLGKLSEVLTVKSKAAVGSKQV
jgi:Zn-dependent peptidase ImmA (M78 family)